MSVDEASPEAEVSTGPQPYDLRKAVQLTAPIIGGIGGFVVTAIVLVLTVAAEGHTQQKTALAFAAALLAVSLVGCLMGAFSLAGLAGESKLTVNLQPAAMLMSIGPIIAIAAILSAFQVLAALYIPGTKGLFTTMAALFGIAAGIFNATYVIDEWDIAQHPGGWVRSRKHARELVRRLSLVAVIPVILGYLLYLLDHTFELSIFGVTVFAATGMVISCASSLGGILRTMHPDSGVDTGMTRFEAVGIQLVIGSYIGAMLLFLP